MLISGCCSEEATQFAAVFRRQLSVLTIDTFDRRRQRAPVPRTLRIQYPVVMYHAMNRGERREDICLDNDDRKRFLCTSGEAGQKTGWQVHGVLPAGQAFSSGDRDAPSSRRERLGDWAVFR